MKSYQGLHCLLLLMLFSRTGVLSADTAPEDAKQPAKPSDQPGKPGQTEQPGRPEKSEELEKPVQPRQPEKPVQPGQPEKPGQQEKPVQPEKPAQLGQPHKPTEQGQVGGKISPTDPKHEHTPSKECKPSEVLTVHKGCVDREAYMQRVILRTWDDENMDEVKQKVGLDRSFECAEGELQTAFGCAPDRIPRRGNEWERAIVLPSHLYGNQVYKSDDGMPVTDNSRELFGQKSRYPLAQSEMGLGQRPAHSFSHSGGSANLGRISSIGSDRTVGHNRPRSYVYLPGRQLYGKRKCRPYEVLGIKGRCIRRKGKVGIYKHEDHKYGMQRRHRHGAFKVPRRH